jgi:hypothetical protein
VIYTGATKDGAPTGAPGIRCVFETRARGRRERFACACVGGARVVRVRVCVCVRAIVRGCARD